MSQRDGPASPSAEAAAAAARDDSSAPRRAEEISWILDRRSVAVKRLGPPAPTGAELELILRAALTAPDHGGLRPWRVVRCRKQSRARLAALFVAGRRRRHPDTTDVQIEREREKAVRPPVLLALIASPSREVDKIPPEEQIASAGAALQAMLLAAQGLGYGAIILSGSRCTDPAIRAALGVAAPELLLGFVSVGSIVEEPKLARRPELKDVVFDFDGEQVVPSVLHME